MGAQMEKLCNSCGKVKNGNEFNKDKSKPLGLTTYCKTCRSKIGKQRYGKNKDIIKKKSLIYRYKNKDRISIIKKEYRNKNKDILSKNNKIWREKIKIPCHLKIKNIAKKIQIKLNNKNMNII